MADPIDTENPNWHALSVAEAFVKVASDTHGLTSDEAQSRLAQFGRNELEPPKHRSLWARLFAQIHNVLIYVLLAAGLVTALLQHWTDTGVILGVVVVNALIGFIQEGKAERALHALGRMLSLQATVLRDAKRQTLPAAELVPGDVVYLQPGDRVSADMRLFEVKSLRVDEAALTGESVPVAKRVDQVSQRAVIGDRVCLAFMGTLVTSGYAMGVVVATGSRTELGQISGMLARVQVLTTRLLQKIAQFGRWLTVAIIAAAAGTFAYGTLVKDYLPTEMFLAAVGLAVAAIPEGLPAIITITLAIGVQRMAKRNAIIRRLPAVETLGSVTVICSDKTGTLTRNEMTVKTIVDAHQSYEVTGVGYAPVGELRAADADVITSEHPILLDLLRAGLLCNEASLVCTDGQWTIHGDPTEGALVTLAAKSRLTVDETRQAYTRIDAVPFESEHRYMATLHCTPASDKVVYVKGAPERVLQMCSHQLTLSGDQPIDEARWQAAMQQIAQRGQRVLAIARAKVQQTQDKLDHQDVQDGLSLLGLVGIIDPPRGEAMAAVERCHAAGIQVKMITGDHVATAKAISDTLGIGDGVAAMTGEQIEATPIDKLKDLIGDIDVFARVSPEHKLRLVEALQARGEVVAMTGDGVNDAPALKRADVGVAMGMKGTEVAKEAAEMVLADDNFASITHAVEEGRTVYDNIKKAIIFILPTNAAEAGTIVAAILAGRMLPITPLQILWVNTITAVTLALALAFEPAETDVMRRPPRPPKEPILTRFVIWRILFVGSLLVAGVFSLFLAERGTGTSIEVGRTVAVNALVMFEVVYLLNSRFLTRSAISIEGILGSGYVLGAIAVVVAAQLLFTYVPPMQQLFETQPLPLASWWAILTVAVLLFFFVELEKWAWRQWETRK